MQNVHGKEIDLLRTTVKVPGKRLPRATTAAAPGASPKANGLAKERSSSQLAGGTGESGVPRAIGLSVCPSAAPAAPAALSGPNAVLQPCSPCAAGGAGGLVRLYAGWCQDRGESRRASAGAVKSLRGNSRGRGAAVPGKLLLPETSGISAGHSSRSLPTSLLFLSCFVDPFSSSLSPAEIVMQGACLSLLLRARSGGAGEAGGPGSGSPGGCAARSLLLLPGTCLTLPRAAVQPDLSLRVSQGTDVTVPCPGVGAHGQDGQRARRFLLQCGAAGTEPRCWQQEPSHPALQGADPASTSSSCAVLPAPRHVLRCRRCRHSLRSALQRGTRGMGQRQRAREPRGAGSARGTGSGPCSLAVLGAVQCETTSPSEPRQLFCSHN